MDGYNVVRDFWTPVFAYVTLLGVFFLFLGFGLGCLACAARRAEKKRQIGSK